MCLHGDESTTIYLMALPTISVTLEIIGFRPWIFCLEIVLSFAGKITKTWTDLCSLGMTQSYCIGVAPWCFVYNLLFFIRKTIISYFQTVTTIKTWLQSQKCLLGFQDPSLYNWAIHQVHCNQLQTRLNRDQDLYIPISQLWKG